MTQTLIDYGFDPDCLDAFLRRALPNLSGLMTLQPISGGQSNPTYFVSYDNRRLVLRKRPAGPVLPSAHAIDREHRANGTAPRPVICPMSSVWSSGCPITSRVVPRLLLRTATFASAI